VQNLTHVERRRRHATPRKRAAVFCRRPQARPRTDGVAPDANREIKEREEICGRDVTCVTDA